MNGNAVHVPDGSHSLHHVPAGSHANVLMNSNAGVHVPSPTGYHCQDGTHQSQHVVALDHYHAHFHSLHHDHGTAPVGFQHGVPMFDFNSCEFADDNSKRIIQGTFSC